jgi:hypothetical protein
MTEQADSDGNASDLHSGGVRFESWPGLSDESFFVVFSSPSGQIPE